MHKIIIDTQIKAIFFDSHFIMVIWSLAFLKIYGVKVSLKLIQFLIKWITNIIYIKTSQDNCYCLSLIEDPYPRKAIICTSLVTG
ncbi:hypothetical protein OENI_10255 [Oenococcus oeni]|nr:hypothetical protein OENI_10255 [Oenococcus oeni]SYW09294.1 hypothetical protein OENI_70056 [Oenococcus oeni]SYW11225.1 hypothetical protein OENI_60074 [Oenococcus oeni]SYW17848.1 hypothetical protein OENI_130037 [Oenococcus oeni]